MDETFKHVRVDMGYTLTEEYFERAAKSMAETINGGDWAKDYTEAQKNIWRNRLKRGLTSA